jgi:hypothetical protein
MITEEKKRQQILKKIVSIPSSKLKELEDFISILEEKINAKSKLLSFAGAWENIEDSVLIDFTENLIENRKQNKRRFLDE